MTDPFLDLDIEPTQCTSSDAVIVSPMISSKSSASGLVTVTPALGNTSLHSDTLESLSTAKHNDLISSTALTLATYSGTVGSVTAAPLGNVTSAPLGNVTSAPLGNVASHRQPLTTIDHQQLHGSNYVDIRSFHDMKSISHQHKIRISRDVVRDASVRATHLDNFGWIMAQQVYAPEDLLVSNYNGKGRMGLSPRRKRKGSFGHIWILSRV